MITDHEYNPTAGALVEMIAESIPFDELFRSRIFLFSNNICFTISRGEITVSRGEIAVSIVGVRWQSGIDSGTYAS